MKTHLSFPVTNIEATTAFYSAFFASAPTKRKPDYVKFEPEAVALNISFHQAELPASRPHLGFICDTPQELDEHYARLSRAGLVAGRRESSVCCYADQDKFHVRDPDGYEWEIYVLLKDTDLKQANSTGCCGSEPSVAACC